MEATPAESGAPPNLVNSDARHDELEETNRGDQYNASNSEPTKEGTAIGVEGLESGNDAYDEGKDSSILSRDNSHL
jgi:hypothetical protein